MAIRGPKVSCNLAPDLHQSNLARITDVLINQQVHWKVHFLLASFRMCNFYSSCFKAMGDL